MSSRLTTLASELSSAQIQKRSRDSYQWLTQKVSEIKNPLAIPRGIKAEKQREIKKFVLGGMYCFYYDPKTKDDLPYYDKFPLVLVLERYPDGFLGLNLHYLPIKYRVAFLDKLLVYGAFNDNDDPMRVRVTYDILNASRRFREFKPCIKRYLYNHLQSKILAIQPNEWEVATFLPMYQFRGAKPKEIWQDSLDEIRKN